MQHVGGDVINHGIQSRNLVGGKEVIGGASKQTCVLRALWTKKEEKGPGASFSAAGQVGDVAASQNSG